MGQLSSPPISARKVASWLIESFANPEKPLSTVALLLSEAPVEKFENPKTRIAYNVEQPTSDAVRIAIREWKGVTLGLGFHRMRSSEFGNQGCGGIRTAIRLSKWDSIAAAANG